jgi:hypothetical protein
MGKKRMIKKPDPRKKRVYCKHGRLAQCYCHNIARITGTTVRYS